MQKRPYGKTGIELSVIGFGGIMCKDEAPANARSYVGEAVDLGINYFESARAYSGSEAYYGLALKERRKDIFLTSKSHARDKAGAQAHLRETLKNMNTDHLDLWQVHDVRTEEEL